MKKAIYAAIIIFVVVLIIVLILSIKNSPQTVTYTNNKIIVNK